MAASATGDRLGVIRGGDRTARQLAELSATALDRPLRAVAELTVACASEEALLLGAFQRSAGLAAPVVVRRGSGGCEVRVGPGTLYVGLALAHPGAFVPCDPARIVNRHVRPLLRALTRSGHLAHHFGRDWISVAHRPVAWVGFAHDAASGRTAFEALIAVRTPFATTERASFRGKPQATLESLAGRAIDERALGDAVVDAYTRDLTSLELPWADLASDGVSPAIDPAADPPWAATVEEAIGTIGAGPDARGAFRVGGDLLVSRDALARLEAALGGASDDDVPAAIDRTLAAPGVALEGVRSLTHVADVVLRARHG